MIVLEQEICDCATHGGQWVLRDECGCEEDICPECGYCAVCCEGDHWDEDAFIGQGED